MTTSLYDRLLGHPFVYDRVRPLVVGGIDMAPVYDRLRCDTRARVLDIGCGTGVALRHLHTFERYLGVDIDPIALSFAKQRFGADPRVAFEEKHVNRADIGGFAPTHVVLAGLLHHLDDVRAADLLRDLLASPELTRVVTNDIVFLDGELMSNLLASLDRGRYCRRREGYELLARSAGFELRESVVVRSHPTRGRAKYLVMVLEPTRGGRP